MSDGVWRLVLLVIGIFLFFVLRSLGVLSDVKNVLFSLGGDN